MLSARQDSAETPSARLPFFIFSSLKQAENMFEKCSKKWKNVCRSDPVSQLSPRCSPSGMEWHGGMEP